MSSSKINIEQLKKRLKDLNYFKTVVSPMQASQLLSRIFLMFAITYALLSLAPFLWSLLSNGLITPDTQKMLHIKIGITLFLFLFASFCFTIAKLNRNKTYTKAHQAYLKKPLMCVLKVLARRGDIVLYAYARNPDQQKAIEAILVPMLTLETSCGKTAFGIILSETMRWKQYKIESLKKDILKKAPELKAYAFSLNSITQSEDKGDQIYFLYLDNGLLSSHQHYLRLML